MKIFILTSVALFAEYGDLDSLGAPSVNGNIFPSLEKAQAQMKTEVETEKNEAEAAGYDNFSTKIEEKSASYQQGEIGSGCSYNLVNWEIIEKEVVRHYTVSAKYDDQTFEAFVVESPKEKAYWWAFKGSHMVHFVKGETFDPKQDLIDVPDEDVFEYYGNGTTERPDNVADMETLLWLLRDKN